MTEYDYWKIFPRMPKKVTLGDITVRDGFQHLEKFISTGTASSTWRSSFPPGPRFSTPRR